MSEMITLAAAAAIYSGVYGFEVSPEELKNKRVHHPLGQEFWRGDAISVETFEKSLERTLARQGRASEYNQTKLNKLTRKAAAKSAAITHKGDDKLSPMGW